MRVFKVIACVAWVLAFSGWSGCTSAIAFQDRLLIENLSPAERLLTTGAKALISLQSRTTGAWHSQTYGSMKQGAATTSLAVYALSHLPDKHRSHISKEIKLAVGYLVPGIELQGCICNPDGSVDYPVYSTAMILTAHEKIDLGLTKKQTSKLLNFLLQSQCCEQRGFKPDNPNFGGWDILGPGATAGKTAGANASVTFYVVEALSRFQQDRGFEQKRIGLALQRAKAWCTRLQAGDKGFYFTSEVESTLNKAGLNEVPEFKQGNRKQLPRSYGCPTCDGVSTLLALNVPRTSKEVVGALSWLASYPSLQQVPGFSGSPSQGWERGLKHYYFAARSRLLPEFETEFAKRQAGEFVKVLAASQNVQGLWQSNLNHMREDDPLIATSLSLITLANVWELQQADQGSPSNK